jgi:electron transfer flavoprotein beta subunit
VIGAAELQSLPVMKIAVCVKAVPDASSGRRLDASSYRLDRSGEPTLSDYDTHPIEEALKLRDAAGDGEVVVVSMGPERTLDALRKALAMGADRAVLISDEALAGSDLLGTAKALAGALEREGADLILFGQQSADGDGACLWAAVAEYLRRSAISQVSELSLADGTLTGKRQTEYGYDTIRAPLPVVVAVSDAINVPRYPSLKGIMGAKKKPQEILSAADVGGVAEARTTVLALSPPAPRGESRRIEDDGSAAEQIVEFLAEKRLL